MSYDAPPPPYSNTQHHANSPNYYKQSLSTNKRDDLDDKGPQVDPTDAEMLAEAQQNNQSTKESDRSEQVALDESLSWIANANRQQRVGVHVPMVVSIKKPHS